MAMYTEDKTKSGIPGIGMLFIGLFAGAAVGGIVALIFAPKSGRETRGIIKGKAVETQQMIQSRANDVKERVNKIGSNMRSRAKQEAQQVSED